MDTAGRERRRDRLDPEGRAWRNATRGVVLAVPLFATYAAVDAVVWAPWAFIGLLNTLLPDIGGPLRPRLRTGIEILVGAVLAAFLGALVADLPVLLVPAMFVVAFGAAYAGVLSPYLAAAGTSILLVFLLSSGSPVGGVATAGWRAANVAVGAALAVAAMVALLPGPRRRRVEPSMAASCRAIARLLEPPAGGGTPTGAAGDPLRGDDPEAEARATLAAMVSATTTQRWPPLSANRVDRARLAFAHDLQSLFARAVAIHRADRLGRVPAAADADRAVAAEGLRALADWLVDDGPGPDGTALRAAAGRTAALELDLRAEAVAGGGDEAALDRFRLAHRVAAACRLTAVLADGAASAAFHTEQAAPVARQGLVDVTGSPASYPRRLVLNLSPRSMTFRHAVRLATACAIAVAAEQALHLYHGYWAVLTVVVTLRTSRGASASRSFERLLGTIGGVLLASVGIALAEVTPARTGVIMALTVVTLAATLWTASAQLRWAWGVVAITTCVLTMFQLETPGDWTLEAARVEATVLGLAIALGAAFVLWPGSSAVALRHATADAAAALAELVAALREAVVRRPAPTGIDRARRRADRQVSQARATLGAAHREGSIGGHPALTVAVLELEQAAELVRRVDDALTGTFRRPPEGGVADLLDEATRATEGALREAADRFATEVGAGAAPLPPVPAGPPDPVDGAVSAAWQRLGPADEVAPQVLDAVVDLGTVGHRGEDLAVLATAP